ncbi:calcium-binding protein LPS1-alpha-like [Ostrea edulis]|uniref:calcium-binding protein LPS1-alpha-like n=1 Tax=Ostrea edulis TaxID=37623 RepID=UPI0020957943|nr:calcium-binding protein LPS1-alpha-like [Ostrea edulis]
MLRFLVVAVLLVGSHAQGEVDPKLDMYGIINVLYLKADKDTNGMISEPELEDVYHGFDTNGDGHVTKTEFVTLWQSITHQNQEHAEAFFYLADLNDDNIIDDKDLNPLYNVFDTDGDGQVTANEFATKWMGIILEAPLAVLFERSDVNKDNILSHNEFSKFFSSFDTNGDHAVTRAEFEHGWVSSNFGTTPEADTFFSGLDTNHDGRITASRDLNARFTALDINHDHHLIILEVVKMAALLPKPSLQG